MSGSNHWDRQTLESRVADAGNRARYPAASPDAAEVGAYGELLLRELEAAGWSARDAHVVVLGMTPELRQRLHEMGCRVSCVDNNRNALALYRDWIAPEYQARETIELEDWLAYASRTRNPVHAFVGDGILANARDADCCAELLGQLHRALLPGGCCVFRLSALPARVAELPPLAVEFIRQFRRGTLDQGEFGFAMRKLGFLDRAYDREHGILDNATIYAMLAQMHGDGRLSAEEYAATRHYFFFLCAPRSGTDHALAALMGFAPRELRAGGLLRSHGDRWINCGNSP